MSETVNTAPRVEVLRETVMVAKFALPPEALPQASATTFAPYAPPVAPPERPEKPAAAEQRWNRALAAVLWTMALATVAIAHYAVTFTF